MEDPLGSCGVDIREPLSEFAPEAEVASSSSFIPPSASSTASDLVSLVSSAIVLCVQERLLSGCGASENGLGLLSPSRVTASSRAAQGGIKIIRN